MVKGYVAYYRVSTKKQKRSGLGLESQKAIVEYYSSKENIKVVKYFIEAESGKDIANRPKLDEAIKLCLDKGFTLIVAKLDRLSRDVEHVFKIHKQLHERLVCCDLPQTDTLTLSIFAGLAQKERELISIRTKAALATKKEQGHKLGNPDNFSDEGRKKGSQTTIQKALNNPNNKRAIQLISSFKKEGLSYQKIADTLNNNAFKTATGKPFGRNTVKYIYDKYIHKNIKA
ncbi:recombinase family protein [Aureispira sp. CCB-QB1]|uniref:recombinase family protein n=1 Tax=Aureispira sp. CCB-QB1 TaxID=1313421 RepID=UPI0006991C7E|nr:recombinase family protein [Aureispira sp. CCB-QB1]